MLVKMDCANKDLSVTEVVLWSNPSPTSAFPAQTVTLSEAYTDYDELRFYVRKDTSDASYSEYYDAIPTSLETSYSTVLFSSLGPIAPSLASYSRHLVMSRSNPTEIDISLAYAMNTGGNSTTLVIPVKITGIKYYSRIGHQTYELIGQPPAQRIECGFAPRIIIVFDMGYASTHKESIVYNKDISVNTFEQYYDGIYYNAISVTSDTQLYEIDDTGFTMPFYQNYSSDCKIIAIG